MRYHIWLSDIIDHDIVCDIVLWEEIPNLNPKNCVNGGRWLCRSTRVYSDPRNPKQVLVELFNVETLTCRDLCWSFLDTSWITHKLITRECGMCWKSCNAAAEEVQEVSPWASLLLLRRIRPGILQLPLLLACDHCCWAVSWACGKASHCSLAVFMGETHCYNGQKRW